ncbi:hypothetical protein [Sphingobacterium hotanense]|uniref:hypothetical protein n=1 Tax=Sphingobacterium hotanense TaxID=649196 RepID=UPI0011F20A92|nr:hypothetical protein [Sphingobacterium hotanense]
MEEAIRPREISIIRQQQGSYTDAYSEEVYLRCPDGEQVLLELDKIRALFATRSDYEDLSPPETPLLLTFRNKNTGKYIRFSTSG